jgi:bacillithiol system protein YtxJ
MAFDELTDLLEGDARDIYLLDVLASRPLSQAVAARLGVRHESPQVLVLKDRAVRWHGSHYRVTAEAVRKALAG